ncbi:nuclear transport factor 2 family protein [Eudoraea adriatica]|uniref:nuclear transport factor 2 family protein n=1 Tax=Eudoraea adriatica TaxID=446681 RepID=UPI0003667025|nr:nuclear transport factor 2 family protein [Eudoraea adriatica]
MKSHKLILQVTYALFLLVTISSCNEKNKEPENTQATMPLINKEDLENEVWRMEELYWDYASKNDTIAYKKLWHNDFIGYPSFGNGVSDKSKIASWIPELHEDKSRIYSFKLYRKAVNSIADVVIVFYDFDQILTDEQNNILEKKTFKITHTWKKLGDTWLILGGMAADKVK